MIFVKHIFSSKNVEEVNILDKKKRIFSVFHFSFFPTFVGFKKML